MYHNRQLEPHRPKLNRLEVYWTAVTYKSVASYSAVILVIILATMYLIFPDWYSRAFAKVTTAINGNAPATATMTQKQARFLNLDGKVQVKKVNSVQWVNADYRTPLDKGDLIQTGQDGAARISFADGTWFHAGALGGSRKRHQRRRARQHRRRGLEHRELEFAAVQRRGFCGGCHGIGAAK